MGKHNKYSEHALPQATLDFHELGILTEKEILDTVDRFFATCRQHGKLFVAVIVGKGIHSANGPVIAPLLRRYIPGLSFVKSCVDAPYTRGGSGCFEVKFWN